MEATNLDVFVTDLCATAGPRHHELRGPNGRPERYTFQDQYTPLPLPFKVAQVLIGVEGFEVRDANRNLIVPRKAAANEPKIAMNETVATWSELSQDALVARCNKLAPKKFNKGSKKLDMIEFLTISAVAFVNESAPAAASGADDADAEGEEDGAGELIEEKDNF